MNFIKKQAAGFYLMLLALILGTAGIVFYVINCNTAYFSNLGISWGVVGCLVAGVVLEILLWPDRKSRRKCRYWIFFRFWRECF